MKGLSSDIELAIETILEGLNYEFVISFLDDAKMKATMDSKVASFNTAKKLLDRWSNSLNAPSEEKIENYVTRLILAGESAIKSLREGLSKTIDYKGLKEEKFTAAIKAKPLILDAILELDAGVNELRLQLDAGNVNLGDKEFKTGYPEKFANGEFYPLKKYYKNWYDKENDAVIIDPKSTLGEIIEISGLKIRLPKVPDKDSDILFSDLPKEEQYWRRIEAPKGITPDSVDVFDTFIVEEYRRIREGIWFMNNGVPVYLTGNMYFALQYCEMLDNGDFMNFRYAQLEMFYHLEACIVDKRCFGQAFLKSRRTGFTYIVLSILLKAAITTKNAKYGMTSKSGDDVLEAFSKFSYMFLNLPFWLRPVVKGKEDSLQFIEFGKPANQSKEAKKSRDTNTGDYLNTMVDWRPTKVGSYDSVKLDGYLADECGKGEKPMDYVTHLGQVRPTMMPAGKVVGKAFFGSTMGAKAKGGKQFEDIIKGSIVGKRDETTGKTPTGLYFHFLPAQNNMEQFTDKYGKCWTTTPPRGTYNVDGDEILMGSLDYLMAVEEQLKSMDDKALNEQYRTYPRTLEHALRDEASETVFNITKIHQQLESNEKAGENTLYSQGNFEWKNGVRDSEVEWCPNPKGRFKLAWIPSAADNTLSLRNNVKDVNGKFYPLNDNVGAFGCDPFTLKSTHGKGSKGAIHGKTLHFPEGNAPSNMFFLEYIARPSDETIFFEDVIMACRFYGMPILVESNRIDLLRHMRNRGYRGFAINRLDRPVKSLNENEKEYGGQIMSGKDIIDSHMNAIGSWITDYVGESTKEQVRPLGEMGEMYFQETLKDWLGFDPDNRTDYDATISSGLAIMACQKDKYRGKPIKRVENKAVNLFPKFSNTGEISSRIITNKQEEY